MKKINLKDYAYICVVTQRGDSYNDGGQYGFGYDLYPARNGWIKKYWTSSDFLVCEADGSFISTCSSCEYLENGYCTAPREIVSEEKIVSLLDTSYSVERECPLDGKYLKIFIEEE